MNKDSHQLSEMIPMEGELTLEGQFTLQNTSTSTMGDLIQSCFELKSDFGFSAFSMLGKPQYSVFWETYQFKQGLYCSTHLEKPFIGLYFQLEGSTQAIKSSTDLKMEIQSGETNLMIVPPMKEFFELQEGLAGNTFAIMLSKSYLWDLSHRFPQHLEPLLGKLEKKDFCRFRERNLCITPRMYGLIQRIRDQDINQSASALFLEAHILELLALLFHQLDQPVKHNGHTFSKSDLEHIYMARDILLERLETPPTLAALSRLVGSNEFILKKGFREIFGTSPYAYHLLHKLEMARTYILDTELSIGEIAYRVGYSDPAHLTKAFRRQFGIRPSDLR